MKVGVLELTTLPAIDFDHTVNNLLLAKRSAAIMPQVVTTWARSMGHEVYYASDFGSPEPHRLIPPDVNILFLSAYTWTAPYAYAVAKIFRTNKVRVAIGGPHAKSLPVDCLRFADYVVTSCNKDLIRSVITNDADLGIVDSTFDIQEFPPLEERLLEVKKSTARRASIGFSVIPILTSIGCPNACDFCVDHARKYESLPEEVLTADLRLASRDFPSSLVAFHDANWGVRVERTLQIIQDIGSVNRYIAEMTLADMTEATLKKMKAANIKFVGPGIESWTAYSGKAGEGLQGRDKLHSVLRHIRLVESYIPYVQANFVLGLDNDTEENWELMREFIQQSPTTLTNMGPLNPFGGTPQFTRMHREKRILRGMPFLFYHTPYVNHVIQNEDITSFMRHLEELFDLQIRQIQRDMILKAHKLTTWVQCIRVFFVRSARTVLRDFLNCARNETELLEFHAGKRVELPQFYKRYTRRLLGKYMEVLEWDDLKPDFAEAFAMAGRGR